MARSGGQELGEGVSPCGLCPDLCDLSKDYTCLGGPVCLLGEARFPGEEILLQV